MIKNYSKAPNLLVIYTENAKKASSFFKTNFNYEKDYTLNANTFNQSIKIIFDEAPSNSTIIFITEQSTELLHFSDINHILFINCPITKVLLNLLNTSPKNLYKKIRKGPDLLTMENFGDIEKYIDSVKKDLNGITDTTLNLINQKKAGTIISFTEKNILNTLTTNELYKKAVYTPLSQEDVLRKIQINSINYINQSLDQRSWKHFKIKIYDSYAQYTVHYRRLLHIIDKLNLGIVLKEGWGLDAGTLFKHVKVYNVHLYSPFDQIKIKKILVGLEYLTSGERIVDYDLFLDKKKVKSSSLKTKERYKKEDIGVTLRKALESQLTSRDLKVLKNFEKEIHQG